MTDEIVKSLREDAAIFGNMPLTARVDMHPEFMHHMAELWLAAADEIERLCERIAELEAERAPSP